MIMVQEQSPAAIQADYLTNILRTSGVLADGSVRDAVVETDRPTLLSRIMRLRLTFDRTSPDAPASLIFKTGLDRPASASWNGGEREVAFYTQVAPVLSANTVPRCFDAHWDPETKAWHLLLEDLTDSHRIATEWPLPPSQAQCEAIIAARARLQAAWWDDPRLGVSVGRWATPEDVARFHQRLHSDFAIFADRLGDNLTSDQRGLFERFFDVLPRLSARYHTRRDLTIVQGDSHVWNCFMPRDGGADVRFFDWDSWSIYVAANDLAYMMAMHWYPDRRRQLEQPLLDHYHTVLLAHGVTGYDRRALHDDYRWAVLGRIVIPVFQAGAAIPPVVWWNNLERIMLAVDDLGCRELLA